ncbi:MAG: hypothetical protein SFZ03_00435 [Candidatus Melainabacteria bacterium]|nr:hypothetical protein [Candidatus Melainabacteria bacterium]
MAKFHFSLQTVLEHRAREVLQIQQQLAKEQKLLQEMHAHILHLQKEMHQAYQSQQQLLSNINGTVSAELISAQGLHGYVQKLRLNEIAASKLLMQQQQKIKKINQILLQAKIKARSLEVLSEKQKEAFNKNIQKQEQDLLSEISSRRKIQYT